MAKPPEALAGDEGFLINTRRKAKALTRYLGALGLEVGPDRPNDLLVLLAVLMIEVGGGLSLALGMVLSGPAREATAASPTPDALANAVSVWNEHQRPAMPDQVSGARTSRVSDLTSWLREQGGKAQTSMRRLAAALGRSPSGVHEELRRLVASGLITAVSGRHGTFLALVTDQLVRRGLAPEPHEVKRCGFRG